ncbi:hypothetical protein [Ruegeria sp. 6PALISEP08]|uniref:hypothetical protein n=1 Tax=Ruegeria sp. 6PALISEP08 TaxID=1225660 RepID=UPI00067E950B|nr:hypothetical protein [Ruegeria sp. 6PALISEP08]
MNRKAIAFATEVAADCALPQEMFDPCGKYNAAATKAGDAHNRAFAEHLTKLGAGWVVHTGKAKVSTGRIVLANNGHLESSGFLQRQLMHICLYTSISAPLAEAQIKTLGGQSRRSVTPADPMGTSVRRISGSYGHRRTDDARWLRDCETLSGAARPSAPTARAIRLAWREQLSGLERMAIRKRVTNRRQGKLSLTMRPPSTV